MLLRRIDSARRSIGDDVFGAILRFSLSTHAAAILAAQRFIQKMKRNKSKDEEILLTLHENQSLVPYLPTSQLEEYFQRNAFETSLEDDAAEQQYNRILPSRDHLRS